MRIGIHHVNESASSYAKSKEQAACCEAEAVVTDKTGTPLQAALCDRISVLRKSNSHPHRPSLTYEEVKRG